VTWNQPVGLPPVSAEVRARRKRQNRVIIAVVVLLLVPFLAITMTNQLVDSTMKTWAGQPTFPFNKPTDVYLNSKGDYVVWTFQSPAKCSVSFDQTPVATSTPAPDPTLESIEFYPSAAFHAPTPGTYTVTCTSTSPTGHVMVSTPSPVYKIGIIRLLGWGTTAVAIIIGLVLFILALVNNAAEKRPQPAVMMRRY